MTIIMANESFARFHRKSIQEIEGLELKKIVAEGALEEYKNKLTELEHTKNVLFQSQHLCGDGSAFPVSVDITSIKKNDKIKFYVLQLYDIQEIKKFQRATKKSEEKFHQLFQAAPEGIFLADKYLTITEVNTAGYKMLGYSAPELKGKKITEIIGDGDLSRLEELIRTKNKIVAAEWQLKKKDHMELPVYVSACYLEDEIWIGFVRDLSERKEHNKRIQESENKLRGLMEAGHDAIVIVDSKGKIEFVNSRLINLFGYTKEELIGQVIEVLLPERYRMGHVGHRLKYMAYPETRPMGHGGLDLFGRRKDGSEFQVDVSLTPYQTEHGTVVSAFISDLTDKSRFDAQQKFLSDISRNLTGILDQEEILQKIPRMLVPFLCDFCALLILENKDFKVKSVCHRDKNSIELVDDTVGYFFAKAELTPYNPEMPAEKQKPILIAEVTEAFLHSISQNEEHYNKLLALNPKSFLTVPLISRGELIGIFFMGMSQSGRIFSESDINLAELVAMRFAIVIDNARLYQDSQRAIKLRENILSIVSHDLKNPLSTIKSSIQILPKFITEEENKVQSQKFINIINKKLVQAERLIADLLDFAKIESGTLRLSISERDINNIVEGVVEDFSEKAAKKNIDIKSINLTDIMKIDCDEDRITQVLSNLIGNAIKFTPENGKVEIVLKNQKSAILFSVSDTGKGISQANVHKVFEKYWQAKETAHLGTGLGLPISKGIIEAHNGKIWIDSEEGKGTTFYFTLPKKY
jgi:PAS domain S-box-containing protein